MNIFRTTKTIYSLFFLASSLNPYSFALPVFFNNDLKDLHSKKKQINQNNSLNFFENNPKLVVNQSNKNTEGLEIQSDEQYQENNVIYAEGNVLVTFNGNKLNSDSLIYDKLN